MCAFRCMKTSASHPWFEWKTNDDDMKDNNDVINYYTECFTFCNKYETTNYCILQHQDGKFIMKKHYNLLTHKHRITIDTRLYYNINDRMITISYNDWDTKKCVYRNTLQYDNLNNDLIVAPNYDEKNNKITDESDGEDKLMLFFKNRRMVNDDNNHSHEKNVVFGLNDDALYSINGDFIVYKNNEKIIKKTFISDIIKLYDDEIFFSLSTPPIKYKNNFLAVGHVKILYKDDVFENVRKKLMNTCIFKHKMYMYFA